MASHKPAHLAEAIRVKLATILLREASHPHFHAVSITHVRLSKDKSHAIVGFSCYLSGVDMESLENQLNQSAGYLASVMARTLGTRITPRLHFVYDPSMDFSDRLDEVLRGEAAELAAIRAKRGGGEAEDTPDGGEDQEK